MAFLAEDDMVARALLGGLFALFVQQWVAQQWPQRLTAHLGGNRDVGCRQESWRQVNQRHELCDAPTSLQVLAPTNG